MVFVVRKIDQAGASFGDKLKALRHDRGYNIPQVSLATQIHQKILLALEANEFAKLPEPIYTRNFLKTYIRFLEGDEQYFLNCFEDARGTCDFIDPMLMPRKKVRRALFLVTPRIFRFVGLGAFACLILVYLGVEIRSIIVPPTIELSYPADGLATDSAIIAVQGRVFEQSEVEINGERILLNQDGTFVANVDLQPGLNMISIEAKKRHSRTSTIYRRVILETSSKDLSAAETMLNNTN